MGTAQAKAYQAEYLKPNTLPDDRIALLYDNLKKYNLIQEKKWKNYLIFHHKIE